MYISFRIESKIWFIAYIIVHLYIYIYTLIFIQIYTRFDEENLEKNI